MLSAISFGVLLPLSAFHQRNHAIQKRLTRVRRDLHRDDIGEYARSAGNSRSIATSLADHGS